MKFATRWLAAVCTLAIIALTPATASATRWHYVAGLARASTTSVPAGATPTAIHAITSIGIRISSVQYPGAIVAGTTTAGTRDRRARFCERRKAFNDDDGVGFG